MGCEPALRARGDGQRGRRDDPPRQRGARARPVAGPRASADRARLRPFRGDSPSWYGSRAAMFAPPPTVCVGIDENGLGPRLGPLVVTAILAECTPEGRLRAERK